jgi:hypothetical protein
MALLGLFMDDLVVSLKAFFYTLAAIFAVIIGGPLVAGLVFKLVSVFV